MRPKKIQQAPPRLAHPRRKRDSSGRVVTRTPSNSVPPSRSFSPWPAATSREAAGRRGKQRSDHHWVEEHKAAAGRWQRRAPHRKFWRLGVARRPLSLDVPRWVPRMLHTATTTDHTLVDFAASARAVFGERSGEGGRKLLQATILQENPPCCLRPLSHY